MQSHWVENYKPFYVINSEGNCFTYVKVAYAAWPSYV
jgi:hypothetical protein